MSPDAEKRRVVLVASLGRSGSSALMGLLRLMGAYVGREEQLVEADGANPKGYFELDVVRKFFTECFREHFGVLSRPPSFDWLEERISRESDAYFDIINVTILKIWIIIDPSNYRNTILLT